MKLKLDENLGRTLASYIRRAGHDVETVLSQKMAGAVDDRLIDTCANEGRCLVTLDMDFANPLVFDPACYKGIAVLRPVGRVRQAELTALIDTLLGRLAVADVTGRLWIVQRDRVREYRPEE